MHYNNINYHYALAIENDQEQESDFEDVYMDSEAQEDQVADLEDGESEQSNADMEIESNQNSVLLFKFIVYIIVMACIHILYFRNGCGSKQ